MARIRFAGKYYPLPDDEVEEFKTNLIGLALDPTQASFALKVRRGQGQDWLWITPGASVVIESSDEIPDRDFST
jgi:hypothetical protein